MKILKREFQIIPFARSIHDEQHEQWKEPEQESVPEPELPEPHTEQQLPEQQLPEQQPEQEQPESEPEQDKQQ